MSAPKRHIPGSKTLFDPVANDAVRIVNSTPINVSGTITATEGLPSTGYVINATASGIRTMYNFGGGTSHTISFNNLNTSGSLYFYPTTGTVKLTIRPDSIFSESLGLTGVFVSGQYNDITFEILARMQ